MFTRTTIVLLVLMVPVIAQAQHRPLSPPDRPPVPLSDADQRARSENGGKESPKTDGAVPARVKIPLSGISSRHISSGNSAIDAIVNEAALRFGLDPCLVLSVMRAESGFNRSAVSVKGASGLMQLMPQTAARFGVRNIFDPRENILAGARYLRWLLDRFQGDVRLALAGYNAGEGAVELYGHRIPPFMETQNYVRTIYGRYSTVHAGLVTTPAVQPTRPAIAAAPEKIPTYNQVIRFTSSSGDGPASRSGQ